MEKAVKEAKFADKKIPVLICALVIISGITFAAGLVAPLIGTGWLSIAVNIGFNLLNAAVAFVAMKMTGMNLEKNFKDPKQYIIGIAVAAVLSLGIAFIPAMLGTSLVGGHQDFDLGLLIFYFFYYILVIGPVEEILFREYVQGTLIDIMPRNKWIGVIIASFIFGLWHIINGSLIQVLFTFGIGMVFGFVRYLCKPVKFPGISLCHGLYDFLNHVVRMFII